MLSRPLHHDPPSALYTLPLPTQNSAIAVHTLLDSAPSASRLHNAGLSMDPSSVDFRAFYPYTPNEVKHRKRTTSTQLKTLESVFKRDTKPNGPLRVELAQQLGMTARGVQVWFQNRRAKEKLKAGKAAKAAISLTRNDTGKANSLSQKDAKSSPSSPVKEADGSVARAPTPEQVSSAPQVQDHAVVPPHSHQQSAGNEVASALWQEQSSEAAHQVNRPYPPLEDGGLQAAHRRGSLPANALFPTDPSTNSPQPIDAFDPFARRRSVDASLQRLASNPYAPLARAKNGLELSSRIMTASSRLRQLNRSPYGPIPPRTLGNGASMPYRLDMRRASMDSRALHFQSRVPTSPSPSPLSPYHVVRGSLPDHNLYAISSRPVASPIPGPLPSPNFSFGAASTPSMGSTSSGESERNSPDSLHSLNFRGEDFDEDDRTSASYDSFSRFGSITSIATSESSINSNPYYPEAGNVLADNDAADMHSAGRRDSCTSGTFVTLMSNLDVNGMPEQPQLTGSLDTGIYASDDLAATGIVRIEPASTYPSPTSTISPGTNEASPTHEMTRSAVPISRSSELALALQGDNDQQTSADERPAYETSQDLSMSVAEVHGTAQGYFYIQNTTNEPSAPPAANMQQNMLEYSDKYEYEARSHTHSPLVHAHAHDTSASYVATGYTTDDTGQHMLQQHAEYQTLAPMAIYTSYGDPGIAPVENVVQSADTYVTYV